MDDARHPSLDDLRIDRGAVPPRRRRGWIVALAAVAVAAAGLLAASVGVARLSPDAATPSPSAAAAEPATAPATPAADTRPGAVLDASGYVTARRRSTISSKVTGRIEQVLVEEGMEVAAGQPLARLDAGRARAELALAEATLAAARGALAETRVRLAEARTGLDRAERLHAAGILDPASLDARRAEADSLAARLAQGERQAAVAEGSVEVRRQDLADTVIRAPFAGIVVSKNAQPGEMISPVSAGGGFTRTGICTLVDMASLEIEVDVNESFIQRVEPGQPVEAVLDAYPRWRIPAHVITSVPTADRQKATVKVRIGFDEIDRRVLPDMGVRVSFYDTPAAVAPAATPPGSD
ncbi:MAG TPA: efflux RND transporter periplasmic adaptor subunit [Thermoanaerobaculia bacterium]|nr:efflux RND transporter periplasmic adaptor subunit [Thermoanaerobaculia bacterium]